jgi:hypothetical protein
MDGTLYMLVPLSPSCRNRSCKSRAKLRATFAKLHNGFRLASDLSF